MAKHKDDRFERSYIDDSMPWRFDPDSMIELDENDHTVIDVWKIVRQLRPDSEKTYYSLKLDELKLNKMLEVDGEYYGMHYNIL